DDHQVVKILVVHGKLAARDPKKRHGAMEHRFEQRVELQLARQVRERIEERTLLGCATPFGGKQAHASDRGARLRRGRRQNLEITLTEGPAPVVLRDQLADRALTSAQRHAQFRCLCRVCAEPARAGLQRWLERLAARQIDPRAIESEHRVQETLDDVVADALLIERFGDSRAEPEQRGSHGPRLEGVGLCAFGHAPRPGTRETTCFTSATSSSRLRGPFCTTRATPPLSRRRSSSVRSLAVITTTAGAASGGWDRSPSRNSKPSISGIMRSSSTSDGESAITRSRPARPLAASETVQPSRSSDRRSIARVGTSSSTISTPAPGARR